MHIVIVNKGLSFASVRYTSGRWRWCSV